MRRLAKCWNASIWCILFANPRHNLLVFESILRAGRGRWRLDGKVLIFYFISFAVCRNLLHPFHDISGVLKVLLKKEYAHTRVTLGMIRSER